MNLNPLQRSCTPQALPSRWELEWRVVDLACDQMDLDRSRVTPESRMVEDLNIDSLEVVEFLMAVEEAFDVELPDDEAGRVFSERGRLQRRCRLGAAPLEYWGPQRADDDPAARRVRTR